MVRQTSCRISLQKQLGETVLPTQTISAPFVDDPEVPVAGAHAVPEADSGIADSNERSLFDPSEGYLFIECPGATLYDPVTGAVTAGVEFIDDDDPGQGHRIVGQPVYAPTHRRKRRIRTEAIGRIRRCEGCQDYTVRMRRPEGRDFFIPSTKHPGRTRLKAVSHVGYEP